MTASAWDWLWNNYGNLASVAGVVLSGLAWVQAGKARDAAEAAGRAVRERDTAHEFCKLADDARALLTAVQSAQADRIISSANNLAHMLGVAEARRSEFLPSDFDVEQCIENLNLTSRDLSVHGFPADDPVKREKLEERVQNIHSELCRIAGSVERGSEEMKG